MTQTYTCAESEDQTFDCKILDNWIEVELSLPRNLLAHAFRSSLVFLLDNLIT